MDSFAAVLPTPGYSNIYEAMCVKGQILCLQVTIIAVMVCMCMCQCI
jgi:hypothetical protein